MAAARAAFGEDSRYLVGGQSLVQAMKLRLSTSATRVDLGSIDELRAIRGEEAEVRIGAMATHAAIPAAAEVRRVVPALADLAQHIGNPMVRNMGTLGGAVANADPAADYSAAVLALGATVHTDRRSIASGAFFTGLFETALEPGELITAISFSAARRAGYAKFRQPASRFALIGVFVADTDSGIRVAVTGAKGAVFRAEPVEAALSKCFTPEAVRSVKMPADGINGDLHGSAVCRAALITVVAARAVATALGSN